MIKMIKALKESYEKYRLINDEYKKAIHSFNKARKLMDKAFTKADVSLCIKKINRWENRHMHLYKNLIKARDEYLELSGRYFQQFNRAMELITDASGN
jgi:hypothetical protein